MVSVVGPVQRKIQTFWRMSTAQRLQWLRLRRPSARHVLRVFLIVPIYGLPAFVLVLAGVRFLPIHAGWSVFGELINRPANYVRAMDVGVIPRRTVVLVAPSARVTNRALAREWGTKVKVVDNRIFATLLVPFTWLPIIGYGLRHWRHWRATGSAGQTFRGGRAQLRSETLYVEKHGDLKVLDLSHSIATAGQERMREFGLTEGDWWVTLYAREAGFHQDAENARNSDIMSYLPAAEAVVERGGWVFRIGDPTMTPLPPMDRVIDYVHTDGFSDWMDLYLAARCRFMLGTSAGPCDLPVLYGRPMVCANYVPLVTLPYTINTLVIPKLAWLVREQRFMSTSEVLALPPGVGFYDDMFVKDAVTFVDNSLAEIKAVTVEMLGLTDGSDRYSDEDDSRQRRFKELWSPEIPPELWRGRNRLGREFAREHPFVYR
jgi:putative glycosyltransferase (TIGR04372 family)